MTYEDQSQVLHKRAIVYLPYGYSEEKQYNVFYLMPTVESTYSTYAEDTTPEALQAFRDHRAFCGFPWDLWPRGGHFSIVWIISGILCHPAEASHQTANTWLP